MKILIDGVRLTNRPAGVIDITISIINALSRNFPNYEILVITHNELHVDVASQIENSKNIKVIVEKTVLFQSIGLYWSLFKINSIVRRIKPDLFIAPNSLLSPFFFPKNIKVALYIHDLVYLLYPESMSLITKIQMKALQKFSIKRADFFWTNSKYTKEQLELFFSDDVKHKAIFSGSGINANFLNNSSIDKLNSDKFIFHDKKYLLFVGTQEPRKNILFLLQLFAEIRDKDYHLVIVGNKGWGQFEKSIDTILNQANYPKDRLHFTGYVELVDLIAIYKQATLFVSTSLNEGLGLPQLEAMALGVPVISPDNSAMKEVVSGAGITVTSWDFKDWNTAIEAVAANRLFYIEKGYQRVLDYNWDTVVINFDIEILIKLKQNLK
ncbi:glycosyltransferase family 4 protein [Flavobacterium agrisoli]|uniref:Glycosyltransferase family 4 protein n=1 Tax=Flavobacterium agrisoli TaxID=2793066 RepID=A0A934UL56_9FLAO|nr:glycosyltransferase family 1 protein [Flavobacterium agrisoli]MBK0371268.1 glycosyltransferase family 4 protein [Flavobacterium agrisoli]